MQPEIYINAGKIITEININICFQDEMRRIAQIFRILRILRYVHILGSIFLNRSWILNQIILPTCTFYRGLTEWNNYESFNKMSIFPKKLNYFQFLEFHIWVEYLIYSALQHISDLRDSHEYIKKTELGDCICKRLRNRGVNLSRTRLTWQFQETFNIFCSDSTCQTY